MHANLFAAVKKLNNGVTPADKSFEALYEQYRKKKNWQHEYMADKYNDIMIAALKRVHPLLNDQRFMDYYADNTLWNWDKFYEYVSYRGLENTVKGENYFKDNSATLGIYQNGSTTFSTKLPSCD